MPSHQIIINVKGQQVKTLADILPSNSKKLKILFIAKVPTKKSVDAGHYFQGQQGTTFWNKLKEYKIMNVPHGDFDDDHLLNHNYGMTDIVKLPREYNDEPSTQEYMEGTSRILNLIEKHKPEILFFVYKKVLENILSHAFNENTKPQYGFNPSLDNYFNTTVFAYPAPGVGSCTKALIVNEFTMLSNFLQSR